MYKTLLNNFYRYEKYTWLLGCLWQSSLETGEFFGFFLRKTDYIRINNYITLCDLLSIDITMTTWMKWARGDKPLWQAKVIKTLIDLKLALATLCSFEMRLLQYL